jgi:hypothetical protein
MKFGVHTGPQNCTYDDLRRAWRMADENGDRVLPRFADPASA